MKGQKRSKIKEGEKMGMSDRIEAFILELMKQEEDEWLKLQRNEIAQLFGCVPSQINYVISTRFTPEKVYSVRSRRGGGGWVQIRRVEYGTESGRVSQEEGEMIISQLYNEDKITAREMQIIKNILSDYALRNANNTETVRGNIISSLLNSLGT